jgi:Flp pilus assembly protein TadG
MVEFALGATVFFVLILGTFDLARAYLAYAVVANAARETARYGAAHASEANWTSAANRVGLNMAVGIDANALVLTPTTKTIDGLAYINVTGTYPFHTLTPFVRAILGDPIPIQVQTSALAG